MSDNKTYDCRNCRFKDERTNFCGFCMMKIIDELKENRGEDNAKEDGRKDNEIKASQQDN